MKKKRIIIFLTVLFFILLLIRWGMDKLDRNFIMIFNKSMPIGIYKMSELTYKFQKNDIVIIEPSNSLLLFLHKRKYLEDDDKYLLKKIIGVAGDKIEIKGNDVYINQAFVCTIKGKDSKGRVLKSTLKSGVIPRTYFYVGGAKKNSIDSRYFGLIRLNQIVRKVKLVHPLKFL